ncbi:hypothetical protein FGB62_169g311 [Gracilaria domingensis]|nr:hypothetical protein FGB62_169g314 [Gracilaria domingensis]KAI0559073.1 hypothetical protein FGB62_169g311 [Gracilaria domingensis]
MTSATPTGSSDCTAANLSSSDATAPPTPQAATLDGLIASRLRSRANIVKRRNRQAFRQRRPRRRTAYVRGKTSPTPPPHPSPAETPLPQRRGRKRDADDLSGESTDSEIVQRASPSSSLIAPFTPPASPPSPAPCPPSLKRHLTHMAARNRTMARAKSPSPHRAWKRQRFEERRRAMDRNSGQSLRHYEGLAEAAAAGAKFGRRFAPRVVAASGTGCGPHADKAWAAAGGLSPRGCWFYVLEACSVTSETEERFGPSCYSD